MLDHAFDLFDAGDLRGALAVCAGILEIDPDHYGALYLSGTLHAELKEFDAAISDLQRATRLDAARKTAWFNLAKACHDADKTVEARAAIARYVALDATDPEGLLLEGAIFYRLKNFTQALASADRAIALRKDFPDALCNRGLALLRLDRPIDAKASFEAALRLRPDFVEARAGCAEATYRQGDIPNALSLVEEALSRRPDYPNLLSLRAQIFCETGRFDEALADVGRLRANDPAAPRWLPLHGSILIHRRELGEAARLHDLAVEATPDDPIYRYDRSALRLITGDLRRGFEDYQARWLLDGAPQAFPIAAPFWKGEPLAGRSIVVHCEQGLGDTIQFCRYVRLLSAMGARVTLLAQKPLVRLLRDLGEGIETCASTDAMRRFDYRAYLLSLPHVLGTDLHSVPSAVPYIGAEPDKIDHWRRLVGGDGFRVDIVWQGSRSRIDIGRSFPLSCFAPLSRIPGVRLISLQKNDGVEQLSALPQGMRVETLGSNFDSGPEAFLDTAAVMQSLDLVISSDTAIAHLAGALARPTWVVLKHTPDWRWMLERPDSPWYPTMRLFRQKTQGDWPGVFVEIEKALRALVQRAQGGSP